MNEDVLVFGVAPLAFAGVTYLSYWLAKSRNLPWFSGLAAIWLTFTAFMYSGLVAVATVNWDDYLVALVFVSLPTGVGLLAGGAIGWFRGR